MTFENSLTFAKKMDRIDPLSVYRKKFLLPKHNRKPAAYFVGNSLGLQPKATKKYVNEELHDWGTLAVEGHFHGKRPWLYYHKFSKKALAGIVGAKPVEVVAMNQLTVNLHLMMVSFYRPTKQRFKIIMEAGAFSSDQYAVESQIKFHHLNPDVALVELKPRPGEHTLRTEDILQSINEHADQLALVLMPGVQYYTGQFFDIKQITEAGHRAGALVGFDLAHAAGNVPLQLHKDNVDFAVWCSYKYLNSGPGGISGVFVHERHRNNPNIPRFAGWWGHQEKVRFQMKKGFIPMEGADGWQLSNVPVLAGAAHLASLQLFEEAGMTKLRKKSMLLTGYLHYLLTEIDPHGQYFEIITPKDANARGCQLSILMKKNGKKIFNALMKQGVFTDWREPDVIRAAPVPMYNSYEDVYRFAAAFSALI
ncbi:MAG TPA: kynureninase [Cytophagales bacterium]|nr:kynureninase [Cytophagales bacterium]HCR54233.1 kynureninase [Cytophagales bacterium]